MTNPPSEVDVEATDEDDEELDDTIVLPWWQRPLNIVIIVVAVASIAGMVGWLVADTQNEVAASDARAAVHHRRCGRRGGGRERGRGRRRRHRGPGGRRV